MNETNLSEINQVAQNNFFSQNIVPIFSKLGDWVGQISGFTIKKSAEVGLNVGNTTAKIFALIVIVLGIYFSLSISKTGIK